MPNGEREHAQRCDPMSAVIDSDGLRSIAATQAESVAITMNRHASGRVLVIGRDGAIKAKLAEDAIGKRPPLAVLIGRGWRSG